MYFEIGLYKNGELEFFIYADKITESLQYRTVNQMHGIDSVSYTHLDVYKRQVQSQNT